MNQEIKLPPLPETEYLLGIPARPYESEWISRDPAWGDSAMQDYATAAVELDRAQRGEPVAWIWRFPDGGLHETLFGTLVECERDAIGYDGSAVPLYTAPQPSQPKRKPDCRTCHRFISRGDGCNPTFTCVNGSQYVPTVPIHFWETP